VPAGIEPRTVSAAGAMRWFTSEGCTPGSGSACGRFYLYALAGAGQAGVERALENLRAEIERDMKLMGCRSVDQLSRDNLRWR